MLTNCDQQIGNVANGDVQSLVSVHESSDSNVLPTDWIKLKFHEGKSRRGAPLFGYPHQWGPLPCRRCSQVADVLWLKTEHKRKIKASLFSLQIITTFSLQQIRGGTTFLKELTVHTSIPLLLVIICESWLSDLSDLMIYSACRNSTEAAYCQTNFREAHFKHRWRRSKWTA